MPYSAILQSSRHLSVFRFCYSHREHILPSHFVCPYRTFLPPRLLQKFIEFYAWLVAISICQTPKLLLLSIQQGRNLILLIPREKRMDGTSLKPSRVERLVCVARKGSGIHRPLHSESHFSMKPKTDRDRCCWDRSVLEKLWMLTSERTMYKIVSLLAISGTNLS